MNTETQNTLGEHAAQLIYHERRLAEIDKRVEVQMIGLTEAIKRLDVSISGWNETVKNIRNTLYLTDRSLVTRVAIVEDNQKLMAATLKELVDENKESLKEDRKQRWRFMMLIFVSIAGMTITWFAYDKNIEFFKWFVDLFK